LPLDLCPTVAGEFEAAGAGARGVRFLDVSEANPIIMIFSFKIKLSNET
jgi:hypothetical protein